MPPPPRNRPARRSSAACAATVLVLLVGAVGCSDGSAADAPAAATSGPTAGPDVAPPAVAGAGTVCATPSDPVPTSGPAVDAFGADGVAAAYSAATALLTRSTFTDAPLADPQPAPAAFAATEAGLTPAALASFRALTGTLASTSKDLTPQQNADLVSLASYGVTVAHPGTTVRAPGYRDPSCGPATTDVLVRPGRPRALVLRFPVDGTFLLTGPHGEPQVLGWHKRMGLTLVPPAGPSGGWLVDGWRGELAVDGPAPDPAA